MPAAPCLADHDRRLVRYVLTTGPRADRRAQAGLRVHDVGGAGQVVCDLLGAAHLPQAAAIVAAHRLVTPSEIGLSPSPVAAAHLQPRVRRALELLTSGLTASQIAVRLGVGDDTARGYLTDAVQELGAGRRPQAVFLAVTYDVLALSAISPRFPAVVLSEALRLWGAGR